jgi:hypothetical protein
MKFESKAHMAQELIAGKRFINKTGEVLHYDGNRPYSPFRLGENSMNVSWENYNQDIWTEIKPRHIHQDLIDSYQDGQVWQYRHNSKANWLDLSNHLMSWQPDWDENTQYRLHPHNKFIQAYRNGAQIQVYNHGKWVDIPDPSWHEDDQYRIKPATKIVYEWMFKSKFENKWMIEEVLLDEEEAKGHFEKHEYRKTGREFEVEV